MDIYTSIENFYKQVPTIPDSKNYWLIRTLSGELYETFVAQSYIAIGFNEISLQAIHDINLAHVQKSDKIRNIRNLVEEIYDEEKRPGLIANQIYQFTYKIKKGDIVVIPSKDSVFVSFGEVEETPLMDLDYDRNDGCDFFRRKKIRWIKHLRRNELEPLLYKMFFSHNTVNDISNYGNLIESTLRNYFIRDNEEHVVFNIQKSEDIGAIDLFQLGFFLLKFTENFFEENGLEFDIDNFDVKVNLNSKGNLKFITKFGQGAFIIALITVLINGGGGSVNIGGQRVEVSSDGLIQKIIDYQNNKFDRKMVEQIMDSMDSLQVENPKDALELYRQFSVNKRTE